MKKQHSNSAANSLKYLRFLISLVLFLNLLPSAYNQSTNQNADGFVPKHKYFEGHTPTKAMWMSAALPGLGQYYNRKYWKIPIVYSGFATLAYFSIINKHDYIMYRDAYAIKISEEPSTNPLMIYTANQLLSQRELYQKNLELNYILFGAFYLLQIIDATVDAHFYNFDINDDLSIRVDPIFYQNGIQIHAAPGLQIRWKLGNP